MSTMVRGPIVAAEVVKTTHLLPGINAPFCARLNSCSNVAHEIRRAARVLFIYVEPNWMR